jgi:hypothetical protein
MAPRRAGTTAADAPSDELGARARSASEKQPGLKGEEMGCRASWSWAPEEPGCRPPGATEWAKGPERCRIIVLDSVKIHEYPVNSSPGLMLG